MSENRPNNDNARELFAYVKRQGVEDKIGYAFGLCRIFRLKIDITQTNVVVTRFLNPHDPHSHRFGYSSVVNYSPTRDGSTADVLGLAMLQALEQYANAAKQGVAEL